MLGEDGQPFPCGDARLKCLKPVLGQTGILLRDLPERAEELHKDALVCNRFLFTEKYPRKLMLIII